MTSLEVSVKDVFFVGLALALVVITACGIWGLIPRIGRVWRGEKGLALDWSELWLSGAMMVVLGVLPTINLWIGREYDLNHVYDFRSLSGAHRWSLVVTQLALAFFGWGLGGLGVVLGIVSLLRRPKE